MDASFKGTASSFPGGAQIFYDFNLLGPMPQRTLGRRASIHFGQEYLQVLHFASNWILTLIQLSLFKDRQNDHKMCLTGPRGAPTDLLEKALTFRVQQGDPTDLLNVRFVFALE